MTAEIEVAGLKGDEVALVAKAGGDSGTPVSTLMWIDDASTECRRLNVRFSGSTGTRTSFHGDGGAGG